MKFLLYDINPGEQFFKQFAGFMFFVQLAQRHNYTLVLPPFRIRKPNFGLSSGYNYFNLVSATENNFQYSSWKDFYDIDKIKEKYNIILLEDYLKENNNKVDVLLNRITNWDLSTEDGKLLFCGEDIEFKEKDNIINDRYVLSLIDTHLKKYNSIALYGTTFQLPRRQLGYAEIRKNIRYLPFFYNEVEDFIKKNNKRYLAIHWRRGDFVHIRKGAPNVLKTPDELISKCKEKMIELGINSVYLATDSKDTEELVYLKSKLPLFEFKTDNEDLINNVSSYAIIESLICSYADYFMGTNTSLYTENILAERIELGKEKITQEYL